MRKVIYIINYLLCAITFVAAISSCTKQDPVINAPYITFGIAGVDASTKSLMTNESLNSSATRVTVYGVRNNTEKVFDKVLIKKDENSYNWSPENNYYKRTWQSGSYSFYGYTYSGTCTVENEGTKITVSQPTKYIEANMVDYLLSHAYKVSDGSNSHVVMLYMQHAMACAEIVVKQQMPEHKIKLDSITLSGLYRTASMICEDQANANSGEKNVWMTYLQGSNTELSYTKKFNSYRDNDNLLGNMTILAIPQQLTQSTVLTINYSVDEDNNEVTDPTTYSQSFELFNYKPYVWESGHKVRYTLTINTGVELKAEIADWINAGYTEGVIIPTGQNQQQ